MKSTLVLCGVSAIWISGNSVAQVESARSQIDEERTSYAIDAMSFAGTDNHQARLDVFVQVSYENLSFVRITDKYEASYDMTIAIYDSASKLVSEKLWTEVVKPASFDQSVSANAYSLTQKSFVVLPGRYFIQTLLRDNETKISKRALRQIDVPDYSSDSLMLSDLMLLSRMTFSGEKRNIVPAVSSNLGVLTDPANVFFEVYAGEKKDSLVFIATVYDDKRKVKVTSDTSYNIPMGRSQVFMSFDHTALPVGDYSLFIRAYPPYVPVEEDTKESASTSRAFVIRWTGLPRSIKDVDLAIDQIQYVAKDYELAHIKEGKTQEEKQKRFLEYWRGKDPNPNTPRNERMERYYERVEYANKHFKHYIDGWRTDMGMVFIIFGPPSNVERHPFDIDAKPYEVWSYYELNHSFTFVDQSGFGDYRLTTPIWDVWQRPND